MDDGRIFGLMFKCTIGWIDYWMNGQIIWIFGQMFGWIFGCIVEWINIQMDV